MSQPAKVLLLYAHPESQDSVANRVLLKPAIQHNNVTVILIFLSTRPMNKPCYVSTTSLFFSIPFTPIAVRLY